MRRSCETSHSPGSAPSKSQLSVSNRISAPWPDAVDVTIIACYAKSFATVAPERIAAECVCAQVGGLIGRRAGGTLTEPSGLGASVCESGQRPVPERIVWTESRDMTTTLVACRSGNLERSQPHDAQPDFKKEPAP
jgi:hypothetical protein